METNVMKFGVLFVSAILGAVLSIAVTSSATEIRTSVISTSPQYVRFTEPMTSLKLSEFEKTMHANSDASSSRLLPLTRYQHPALGDNGSGILARLYEFFDSSSSAGFMKINGSADNGLNWGSCCWIDLYGGRYPSVDFWGFTDYFCGTFVPPADFENGAAFFLVAIPDPLDYSSWFINYSSLAASGWHDMKMVEIACDDAHQNWNWGFQAAVLSRTAPGEVLVDVPFVFGSQNNMPFGSYYPGIQHALTAAADIDHSNGRTYAAYGIYDSTKDQYQLFLRQDFVFDWYLGTDAAVKACADTNEQITNPAIAVNYGHLLVVAELFHDSAADNKDIVCFYSSSGDVDSLSNLSTVAATGAVENFPDIACIDSAKFVCTFVREQSLYATWSLDAGAHWTPPVKVNAAGEDVVEEYRTSDIGDGGRRVMYEYRVAGDSTVHLGLRALDFQDSDGDGIADPLDNCPNVANPTQTDSDGDGRGNVCDNCPTAANPDQADADHDGIGDACDPCTDTDGDGFGNPGFVANTCLPDNCPNAANPTQTDSDGDGVGDACDFCGNADGSAAIDISDAVALVNYIFSGGPAPQPVLNGDANCDAAVDISDVVFLIAYIFAGGMAPCSGC
jgi:hypothetical protein